MARLRGIFKVDFYYKRQTKHTISLLKVILLTFFVFSIDYISISSASKYVGSESNIKAAFLYHFTKFVNWPENTNDNNQLLVGVMASGEMLEAIMALDGKKSLNKVIKIKKIDKICSEDKDFLKDIKIIFLQANFPCNRDELIDFAIKNHILTVSDEKDLITEGIVISLYKVDTKIRFDINLKIAQKSQLVISSKLLRLARRVVR